MRSRIWIVTTFAAGALVLAGCGSTGGSTAAGPTTSTAGNAGAAAPAGAPAALKTASSPLGEVVVTSNGSTVYVFDKDTPGGASTACTGACVGLWPEVTTTSATPQVSGVTGTVGTAAGNGGTQQLTLDGRRLYTYSGDSGPGQVTGQGFKGIWWVVSPSGQAIKTTAAATSSAASSPSY